MYYFNSEQFTDYANRKIKEIEYDLSLLKKIIDTYKGKEIDLYMSAKGNDNAALHHMNCLLMRTKLEKILVTVKTACVVGDEIAEFKPIKDS